MRQMRGSITYLWSFGRLLRKLRGPTSLETIAERGGFQLQLLQSLEARTRPADEWMARHILERAFHLQKADVDQLILGLRLWDLGLRDNELRQLVIEAIRKTLPNSVRKQLHQVYRELTARRAE